jgi:hypothetical protein
MWKLYSTELNIFQVVTLQYKLFSCGSYQMNQATPLLTLLLI